MRVEPDGDEHPRWSEIEEFIGRLGYELDPWQWMVLRAAFRRRGELWAAFTVAVCAPRQNGKNSLLEVVEMVKAILLREKLQIHTAHLTDTAKEAFYRIDDLLEVNGWIEKEYGRPKVWRANGMEAVHFSKACRLRFRTRTKGGGRGYAGCRTAFFDEAMFLPEVSMGSILPVLSASPDPQIWYTGSAVDQEIMDEGVAFARVRERALEGDTDRLAYFEWSVEAETPADVDDETAGSVEAWASANPALGIRISPDYVKVERGELDPRTFAVERLGVGDWPPTSATAAVDLAKWNDLEDQQSQIVGPIALVFDVKPDRSSSSIGVAGLRADGKFHIELVDRRRHTNWVVPRILELAGNHEITAVLTNSYGAGGALITQLEDEGVMVTQLSARDMADACGLFYDSVEEAKFRHLGTPEILAALRGAARRPLGDAWAWTHKNSAVDISPLIVVTVALWGAATMKPNEVFASAW